MIEFDSDHDGLMEYPVSGNSGSWTEKLTVRPSNWWDTIGFAHKDAYSNALAYKAFRDMEELARQSGVHADAALYNRRAKMLKAVFYPDLLQSCDRRAGGLEERRWQTARLLFPLCQRRG